MSSSIVIALPKIEDAKKIRTILNRHGLTVASVCSSVSNALANITELDSGVLICGYKLTDAYYKDALDDLPQYFEMLLLASQRIIDEAPNSVSTVQMQMTEDEAYRHIQKCSMDSGTNMVETAQMLLMLMYDEI